MQIFEDNKGILESCQFYLNWHYPENIKKVFLSLAESADVSLKRDFYGKGDVVEGFENKIAKILGKKHMVFMPSGVMAQQIAMRIWSDRKNCRKIGCHPTSHIEKHEYHAYSFLHNLTTLHIGEKDRLVTYKDLEGIKEQISTLILEVPHRENGGITYDFSELQRMSAWTKMNNIAFHMDGARLWECQSFYNKSYAEICEMFDSIYVSFYKGIGGISGAALAFNDDDFLNETRIWQRRLGGNLISLYPYVVAADVAFEKRISKMEQYRHKAQRIAERLCTIPQIWVTPRIPHTNMMHIHIDINKNDFIKRVLKTACEEKICMFENIRDVESDSSIVVELCVGDATLDISDEKIYHLFASLFDK